MDQKYPPAGLISINFALFLCKWRLNGLGKDLEPAQTVWQTPHPSDLNA